MWDEADFALNESTFGALSTMAERFDFAVFVFDADDVAQIRREKVVAVRDNVVFELGLFIGAWVVAARSGSPPRVRRRPTFQRISQGSLGSTSPTRKRPARPGNSWSRSWHAPATGSQGVREAGASNRPDNRGARRRPGPLRGFSTGSPRNPSSPKTSRESRVTSRPVSITSAHGVNADQFFDYLSGKQPWHIIHLAMYVDASTGTLLLPRPGAPPDETPRTGIPVAGVRSLIEMSGARLVVIVTCD